MLAVILLFLLFGCARDFSSKSDNTDSNTENTIQPDVTTDVPPDTTNAESDTNDVSDTSGTDETSDTEPSIIIKMDQADRIVNDMSIEEKIGQLFLARLPVYDGESMILQFTPGGVVMFGNNFSGKSASTVINEIASLQSASRFPLIVAVEEEGGTVTRVSHQTKLSKKRFRSPRDLYDEGGIDLILSDVEEKCALLLSLGINCNLAPVCDISADPSDFMYERSLGRDAFETSEYISAVVAKMKELGVASVLKHFPGYGSTKEPQNGIAVDERDYNDFIFSDFLPFEAGIEAGCGAILVAHNIVNCIDPDNPASLSSAVHRVLRDTLGFEGVIITDNLSIDSITEYTDGKDPAVKAILSGNDLICCNDIVSSYSAVLAAVLNGEIDEGRINESAKRIINWKISLGLIEADPD